MTKKDKAMTKYDNALPYEDEMDGGWSGGSSLSGRRSKSKYGKSYRRCYEDHPEISLGGGTLLGASCNSPRDGFDVYVGFDWGMHVPAPPAPWNKGAGAKPSAIHAQLRITDGSVPDDTGEAKRMVTWLAGQLAAGKRVHIGCIGGHGRTGLVMAALAAEILGEKDAIQWVRKHHCKKAVETEKQVKWLQKHYGVSKAEPSKKGWSTGTFTGKYGGTYTSGKGNGYLSGGKGNGGTVKTIKGVSDMYPLRGGSKYHPLEGSPMRITELEDA